MSFSLFRCKEGQDLFVLVVVSIGEVALKAECHLLHAMLLDVLVGRGDVAVACLVTGNDNTRSIGKVTDAGVLEGVELVTVVPAERSAHLLPALVELV